MDGNTKNGKIAILAYVSYNFNAIFSKLLLKIVEYLRAQDGWGSFGKYVVEGKVCLPDVKISSEL